MSPIYVRPEREQAEHDRLIRFLQARYSQDFEALVNPGDERVAPIKVANVTHFPDLVLNANRRLAGVVEIETVASVNNLETMAKWVPFSRARVPFHLYVPVQGYEAALRLAEAHHVKAAEIWTYRPAIEGFDLVRMFTDPIQEARAARQVSVKAPVTKPATAKAETSRPAAARPNPKAVQTPERRARAGGPAKSVKAARTAKTARPGKNGKKTKTLVPKGAASRSKSPSRPATRPRPVGQAPVKPARSTTRPAPKGGKKGAGAGKGR